MRMIVIMMTTMRMTETLSSESSFRACFNQFAESCNKQEQKSAGVSFSNKEKNIINFIMGRVYLPLLILFLNIRPD